MNSLMSPFREENDSVQMSNIVNHAVNSHVNSHSIKSLTLIQNMDIETNRIETFDSWPLDLSVTITEFENNKWKIPESVRVLTQGT